MQNEKRGIRIDWQALYENEQKKATYFKRAGAYRKSRNAVDPDLLSYAPVEGPSVRVAAPVARDPRRTSRAVGRGHFKALIKDRRLVVERRPHATVDHVDDFI